MIIFPSFEIGKFWIWRGGSCVLESQIIWFLPFRAFCVEWSPKIDDVSRLSDVCLSVSRSDLDDLYHLHHLRAIIKKLEFSVFWLCILKLFCWFLFRFVEMIADDWKDWRLICDNRIHLKDLYHLVSSASSTCDHQKSWSFLFFCCVFESCFVRFRFVLFRWLQMIKKIEDWFAIIFIWNIYIICIKSWSFLLFFCYIF